MISILIEKNCNECPNFRSCVFLDECNIVDYLYFSYSYCLNENYNNCLRKSYRQKYNKSPKPNFRPDGT